VAEFEIARAFVTAELRDNTYAGEKEIKDRLEAAGPVDVKTALKDPSNTEEIKKRVESSQPWWLQVKAKNPIDDTWRAELQRSLNETARESLKIPMTPESEQFRRDLAEVIKEVESGLKTKIPVDVDKAAEFKFEVEALAAAASEEVKVRVPVELDEAAVSKVTAAAKFNALGFALAFAGLPAAAAVAGAGVAAALAVVPLAFAGLAAVALKTNTSVAGAFSDLKEQVVSDTQAMAQPMAGTLVLAASKVGDAFTRIKPALGAVFQDAGPAVLTFTEGITGLVTNAMPGFVSATRNSQAPMLGLKSLLEQTGTGMSMFFSNLSVGAQGSQQVLSTFGGIIQDLLGFTGKLFGNLATNGNPILEQFRGALLQVEGVLTTLTGSGFPALGGAFSGFMSQIRGVLGILQGVTSALGGWAGPLASIAGAFKALDMITFGRVSSALTGLFTSMKTASDGSAALNSGFVSTATKAGAAGAAMVVLGLALKVIGDKSQEATDHLSQHKATVDLLTSAYQKSNGQLDDNVRAALQTDKTFQKMSESAGVLGISTQQLTTDVASGAGAFSSTALTIESVGKALIDSAKPAGTFGQHMQDVIQHTLQFGGAAVDVSGDVETLGTQFQIATHASDAEVAAYRGKITHLLDMAGQYNQTSGAAREAADAQKLYQTYLDTVPVSSRNASAATGILSKAIDTIRDAAAKATDKGKALMVVLDQLGGRAPTFEGATQVIDDGLRTLGDGFDKAADKAGKFDKSMINADGTINTATKNGSDLKTKLDGLQKGFADSAGSIDDMVKAGMPLPKALEKVNDQASRGRDEFIKQAMALGFSKDQATGLAGTYDIGNQALGEYISTMSDGDLKMAGITKTVDKFGNTIVHLPDGKEIKIGANTAGAQANVKRFADETDATTAKTQVGADIDPATKKVLDWKNTTFQTIGDTTTYTNTDPATGQVRNWKVTTDATGAQTTTYSTTNPATGEVTTWKRNTDGTWIQINVGANTAPAKTAIQSLKFLDEFVHGLTVPVQAGTSGFNPGIPGLHGAIGMVTKPIPGGGFTAFAAGGIQPMRTGVAAVAQPGTLRVIGDNPTVPESYIPWNDSQRSKDLLALTNREMGDPLHAGRVGSVAVMERPSSGGGGPSVADLTAAFRAALDGAEFRFDANSLDRGQIMASRDRARR
jgi:hypothetical protein